MDLTLSLMIEKQNSEEYNNNNNMKWSHVQMRTSRKGQKSIDSESGKVTLLYAASPNPTSNVKTPDLTKEERDISSQLRKDIDGIKKSNNANLVIFRWKTFEKRDISKI